MIIYHVAINKSKINIIMLFVEKKKVVHIIVSYVGIVMVHLACRMSITIFSKTYYKLVQDKDWQLAYEHNFRNRHKEFAYLQKEFAYSHN